MIRNFGTLQLVLYDHGVAEIVLCDEVRRNPIDGDFCARLDEISRELENTTRLRAVLLRAKGASFSVGGDLKLLSADFQATPRLVLGMTRQLNAAIVRLQSLDAPLIAAVRGTCAGGMVGLVAGCDIVVACDDARFVAAYAKIGISCDAGASIALTERMGLARARRYLLLNETLDAGAAMAAGLVDFVVPVCDLVARSKALAAQVAGGPTRALGEMRRLLQAAKEQAPQLQLDREAASLSRTVATEDAREGITAFLNKRTPLFRGY